MDTKKISFGFNKTIKKSNVVAVKETLKNDIELIDCLEGHAIKVIGKQPTTKAPLVIPLKEDSKNLLDRIKKSKNIEEIKPEAELTLDELAAKQLIEEAKKGTTQLETKVHELPLSVDKLPLVGEKESTLEDYQNVPIEDFGLAMLRGMGWKDGMNIGKNQTIDPKLKEPELRPKGLGLGACQIVKEKTPKIGVDNKGNELRLAKGAFLKVIMGALKGKYGEVLGFDEELGRVIVKLTISKETVSLNKVLTIPVTKEEYDKCSQILNLDQYEEYKLKTENKQISNKNNDRSSSDSPSSDDYKKKYWSRKKKKHKKERSRSRTPIKSVKSSKLHKSRDKSNDNHRRHERSDSSDYDRKRRKKKSKKSKKSKR